MRCSTLVLLLVSVSCANPPWNRCGPGETQRTFYYAGGASLLVSSQEPGAGLELDLEVNGMTAGEVIDVGLGAHLYYHHGFDPAADSTHVNIRLTDVRLEGDDFRSLIAFVKLHDVERG